ncbi:MAG TPA: hypothetical protein VHO24_09120 [Opitutaceae bacterium]|nr:hypothetical protein [Opitutaceae bacterium]
MRFSWIAFGCVAALSPRGWAAQDPAETVRAVLQDFLDQPSYTWVVSNTRGIPEANGEDTELATEGQHEKGGYTKINLRRGPHIPAHEMPVAKPWPGFMDRETAVSDRWVFWTPDGWQSLRQLPLPPGSGPSSIARPAPRGREIKIVGLSTGGGVSRREIGIRRPDHEIALVLAHLDAVTLLRPGLFEVSLTPAGATQLVSPPMKASVLGALGPTVQNASVQVTIRAKDGQLVSYEIAGEGIMVILGRREPRSFVLIRNLRELGTTEIKVPDEVRQMMGEKPPAGEN